MRTSRAERTPEGQAQPPIERTVTSDTPGATPVGFRAVPISGLVHEPDPAPVRRHSQPGDPLGGTALSGDLAGRLARQRSHGEPLPLDIATSMGDAMGADLRAVRVHTGAEPAALAQSVQAVAFTQGTDIYFGAGTYSPQTQSGQRLLAHELAHTQQPGTAGGPGTMIGRATDPAEAAADRVADGVMSVLRRQTIHRSGNDQGAKPVDPHRAGRRTASPAMLRALSPMAPPMVIRRCKTKGEVFGDAKTDSVQAPLLRAYIAELDDSLGTWQGALTGQEPQFDAIFQAAEGLVANLEQIEKSFISDDLVQILADLVDDVTVGYQSLKNGTHEVFGAAAGSAAAAASPATAAAAASVDTEPASNRPWSVDIDKAAATRLKLTGNSRPLSSAAKRLVVDSASTIRGLKQDLLNDSKQVAATETIMARYNDVKQMVIVKAAQGNDGDVKDYWTMKFSGLVAAIDRAEGSFREGVTCNEELAQWLEEFVAKAK